MGHALRALEEIKEKVAHSPAAIPAESLYQKLLETFPLRPLSTDDEFKLGRQIVSRLVDVLESNDPEDEGSRTDLEKYLKSLARLVEVYEKNAFPDVGKNVSGRDMLKFLMESNGLSQEDLKDELGGQPVVSAILRGSRKLNLRQIAALSVRFNVSPEAFINVEELRRNRSTRNVRLRTKSGATVMVPADMIVYGSYRRIEKTPLQARTAGMAKLAKGKRHKTIATHPHARTLKRAK